MSDAEVQVRELEANEVKALLAGKVDDMAALWSEQYTVNAPNNRVRGRQEVLDAFKTGQLKYTAFDRHVEQVILHGDVAVVMGSETVTPAGGPDAGKKIERRYTDVCIRDNGRWLMLARHANLAAPMKPIPAASPSPAATPAAPVPATRP